VTPDPLLAAADRCVKCGFCLPNCPTYGLFRDESESPRGRIALIQGLVEGRLAASERLLAHLDHCLLCRNCEPVCPSQVPYGEIMDDARARVYGRKSPDILVRLITDRRWLASLRGLAVPLERFRVLRLLPTRWRRMAAWLARADQARLSRLPTAQREAPVAGSGTVALFEGCVSGEVDRAAVSAARRVLARLGFTVILTRENLCCGAVHRHGGHFREAESRLRKVREWLLRCRVDAVLSIASGCGAHLLEEGNLGVPVYDVGAFLATADWPRALLDAMPAQAVLLHQPCTLRNGMQQDEAVAELLARFRGLKLVQLDTGCCGAAGMHLVRFPELASRLAAPLVAGTRDSSASVLLTSNTGCRLHLADELRAAGSGLRVSHPVEFIAEQLGV
jgi:glycolate oxidase iron-sulfur subunit